jgi:hypothetical protein
MPSENVLHLREQCKKQGIDFHPAHRETALKRLLADDKRDRQTDALEAAKRGSALPGMENVKQPKSLPHKDYKYGHAEKWTPPRTEMPEDVLDSLDYISGYSISAANNLARFIDTINHAPAHA